MSIFDKLGIHSDYVILGLAAGILLLLILIIVLFVKSSKLNKRYNTFMQGKDAKSLEDDVISRFQELETMKEILRKHQTHLDELDETFKISFQKRGIVRYDAFKEMGGTLSFALALLNKEDSGFIINSMYSTREGCYMYVKEIIHGESYVVLSEEEQQALDQAIKSTELIQD